MNILETPITLFDGVTSINGHVVSLAEFLNDASSHHLIQQIRMTEDKAERTRLKSDLPCATISAICPNGRKVDEIVFHLRKFLLPESKNDREYKRNEKNEREDKRRNHEPDRT